MFDFNAIGQAINDKIEGLHNRTPRAKCRRISTGNYAKVLAMLVEAAKPDDVRLTIHEQGGFVPNSYRGTAEADHLNVSLDLRTGKVDIVVSRTEAQRRPRGIGNQMVCCLCKEGQTQGRLVPL